MSNPKVLILCMENRSFDEYFGTFPGPSNFYDKASEKVFAQSHANGHTRPFRGSTFASRIRMDPDHSWTAAQVAWNAGAMDGWSTAQGACFETSMSYYAANDIPYHWRLAETFLLCDTYFCSVLGPTWPNRLFLMSGTIFKQPPPAQGHVVPFDSGTDLPALDSENAVLFPWVSYPAMLPDTISWTLYDDQLWQPPWMAWPGTKGPPPYLGRSWPTTFDLNMLDCLQNTECRFRGRGSSTPGASHYSATGTCADVSAFAADAKAGRLPHICWIIPPYFCTEHPTFLPADGESYLARIVEAVIQSPDWSDPGIVLIVTYDENGGFFDHVVPKTSVEYAASDEAWVTDGSLAGPVGSGFRIPTIIVSPWTVGAGLSSHVAKDAVFDHTSVIQYLEKLTGKCCENLPKPGWRRQTFENLCALIDPSKTPVPGSKIELPSLDEVDGWRTDALQRAYGVHPTYLDNGYPEPLLPPVDPDPTQTWPPLEQRCYFVLIETKPGQDEIDAAERGQEPAEGEDLLLYQQFSFVVDGFVPAELNLGKYVPKSYKPIAPKITATLVGTTGRAIVKLSCATPDGETDPTVPRSFSFRGHVAVFGVPQPKGASLVINGSFTSRLEWHAPTVTVPLG